MKPSTRRDPYRLTGETFGGRYRLEEFAGMGSFGAVYRGIDTRLGRTVAVKILRPDINEDQATDARELFQREALTAGRLTHPHIVAVTDVGEEDGLAYLVMEWLEGRTLEDELRQRPQLTPDETATLLEFFTEALQAAHDLSIIHRDIKPSNTHLGKHGFTNVKVLDFGIAKVISSTSAGLASRIAGTLYYMSPEQISGDRIDGRSDIYSLGVMLYQMLTGKLPFAGDSQGQIIQQHLFSAPPPLFNVQQDIAPTLSQVIQRALAKKPEERQQSAKDLYLEFINALRNTKAHQATEIVRPQPTKPEPKTEKLPTTPIIHREAKRAKPPNTIPYQPISIKKPQIEVSWPSRIRGTAKTISKLLGVVFLIVGLAGFVMPGLLGTHLSLAHNLVHIISGAVALYFGFAGSLHGARLFCLVFGAVYLLLAICGFLLGAPGVPTITGMASMGSDAKLWKVLPGTLELGMMDHVVHVLLGLVFLIGGFLTKADVRAATD